MRAMKIAPDGLDLGARPVRRTRHLVRRRSATQFDKRR